MAFIYNSDEIVLAIALEDTDRPTEFYTINSSVGDMVRPTELGHILANQKFGTCTFLSCTSSDGEMELERP